MNTVDLHTKHMLDEKAHAATWEPILAAHRVAAALRTIAEALPLLTAQASDPLYDALVPHDSNDRSTSDRLRAVASLVAAAAPFAALTDGQNSELWGNYVDQIGDMSTRDKVEMLWETMSEADRAAEYAEMQMHNRHDAEIDGEGE